MLLEKLVKEKLYLQKEDFNFPKGFFRDNSFKNLLKDIEEISVPESLYTLFKNLKNIELNTPNKKQIKYISKFMEDENKENFFLLLFSCFLFPKINSNSLDFFSIKDENVYKYNFNFKNLETILNDSIIFIKDTNNILNINNKNIVFLKNYYFSSVLNLNTENIISYMFYFNNKVHKIDNYYNNRKIQMELLKINDCPNIKLEYKRYLKFSKTYIKRYNKYMNIKKFIFNYINDNNVQNINELFQKYDSCYLSFITNRIYKELGLEKTIDFFIEVSKNPNQVYKYYKYIKYYKHNLDKIPAKLLLSII